MGYKLVAFNTHGGGGAPMYVSSTFYRIETIILVLRHLMSISLYFLGNITEPLPKNSENSKKFQKLAIDGFYHTRGHFGIPDNGIPSMYTSADMEEDLTITLQPVNGFQHMRGQSGVVFHAQSNVEVTVQIS